MKTRITSITLEIWMGNIEDAIEDAKELLKITGAGVVKFRWNDIPVKVRLGDDPREIVRKYFKDMN